MNTDKILWKPSEDFKAHSHLYHYEQWLKAQYDLNFTDYHEMWQWSVDNHDTFWESLWNYFEILHDGHYNQICSKSGMPGEKWFEGAILSYSEHIFRKKSQSNDALIFINEKSCSKWSWDKLEHEVKAIQQYLIHKGVKAGDRVAAYVPNIPEAIAAFLAVNSIGAIWSCCSPDFGVSTVVERFEQIKPKILIAVNGYTYNNKPFDRLSEVSQIVKHLNSLEQVISIPYLEKVPNIPDSKTWHEIIESFSSNEPLSFKRVAFNDPIWILYSSGTTGKPKAITHSQGGVLLEHLKYMVLHNNVKEGEHFFWFTTTGWMMWNFLQASLLAGATAVLYDGSPAYPDLSTLWEIADKLPIHHFGTSAPYLTACMKQSENLLDNMSFDKLRSIGSTGAPLPPEAFDWVYNNISKNVWLCSMSGGTDVCTAFVGGNPYLPVIKGRIQSRALGCALYAYDESGNRTTEQLGEMVIEKSMPSMPIYFWNDDNNKRYTESYFEKYPGLWCHGDWIKIFKDDSLIIQGRSDATLNRKGIRIGTSEIYSVINEFDEIKDSLIINIELPNGDDIMPLFIVLNTINYEEEKLFNKIKNALKLQCSPRHVPDKIFVAPDIPYTLSGKKMEIPIKKLFMNMDIKSSMNKEAMKNPECLEYFYDIKKNHF